MTIEIIEAVPSHMPAIQGIYAHWVTTGLASFEEIAPDTAELDRRRREIQAKGLPYLVAVQDDTLLGYAYAGPYRTRPAYDWSVEDSIYVAPDCHRQGIGRILLDRVIVESEARGFRQMIAVIGDTANTASVAVHAAAGFRMIGTFQSIGYKHGRWLDTVLMQRALGRGDAVPPEPF